jgi:hypothetical protein
VPFLPEVALESIVKQSSCDIILGYVSKNDVERLNLDPRVKLVDLSSEASELGVVPGKQKTFLDKDFYNLVQLKWFLINRVLKDFSYEYAIYSDLDVVWFGNAELEIKTLFDENPEVEIAVQECTTALSSPYLCMGFVGFRNSLNNFATINGLIQEHSAMLKINPYTGDDDVMSSYFKKTSNKKSFRLLPQALFPAGNLVNLFMNSDVYPGLKPPKPFIFHANFVTGWKNKLDLIVTVSGLVNHEIGALTFANKVKINIRIRMRYRKHQILSLFRRR